MILQRDLVLLTGGPGTGKTRSIVAMLAAYAYENPENLIALAAPTGKAAFRMRGICARNSERTSTAGSNHGKAD